MVGSVVTSKKVYPKGDLSRQLLRVLPNPCGEPLPTHASTGDPLTLAGSSGLVSVDSLFFSSESWCVQGFICALQDWSLCFPLSCGSLIIKFPWPSRSDSLGIPSPFVGSPGWGAWCRALNLHNSGRTFLVLLFSSLWMTHPVGMGFDFIVIVPLLPSFCSFVFVFGYGVSFFSFFFW